MLLMDVAQSPHAPRTWRFRVVARRPPPVRRDTRRAARVNGRVASWDGVGRQIEIPGQFSESLDTYREGKIWLNRHGASGELAATSLHIAVLSPQGELRYQGRGGLVLLQELVRPQKP